MIGQTVTKIVHTNEHVLMMFDNGRVAMFYPRRVEYEDDYVQEMDVHNASDLKYELQYELDLITEEEYNKLEAEREIEHAIAQRQYQLDNVRRTVKNQNITPEEIFNS